MVNSPAVSIQHLRSFDSQRLDRLTFPRLRAVFPHKWYEYKCAATESPRDNLQLLDSLHTLAIRLCRAENGKQSAQHIELKLDYARLLLTSNIAINSPSFKRAIQTLTDVEETLKPKSLLPADLGYQHADPLNNCFLNLTAEQSKLLQSYFYLVGVCQEKQQWDGRAEEAYRLSGMIGWGSKTCDALLYRDAVISCAALMEKLHRPWQRAVVALEALVSRSRRENCLSREDRLPAYQRLAEIYIEAGDSARAYETYGIALQTFIKEPGAHTLLAPMFARAAGVATTLGNIALAGQYTHAAQRYSTASNAGALIPDSSEWMRELDKGCAACREGKYEKAAGHFGLAVAAADSCLRWVDGRRHGALIAKAGAYVALVALNFSGVSGEKKEDLAEKFKEAQSILCAVIEEMEDGDIVSMQRRAAYVQLRNIYLMKEDAIGLLGVEQAIEDLDKTLARFR